MRYIAFATAAIVLLTGVWLAVRAQRSTGPQHVDGTGSLAADPASLEPRDGDGPIAGRSDPERRTGLRQSEPEPSASGRATDSGGIGVHDVHVSWIEVDGQDFRVNSAARWSDVIEQTQHGRTGPNGEILVPIQPDGDGLILWCSHPRFLAAPFELGRNELEFAVTLESHPGARVVVLDSLGAAVPDAKVIARAATAVQALPSDVFRAGAGVEFVFFRELVTDRDGRAHLHPYPGTVELTATKGGRRSTTYIGSTEGEIRLVLHPTFTLEGRVDPAPTADVLPELSVNVFAEQQGERRRIGAAELRPTGELGPIALPVVPADGYVGVLSGGGTLIRHARFDPPVAGEKVRLEFRLEHGRKIPVRVVDTAGAPVELAEVEARWGGDDPTRSHSVRTDELGEAVLAGCGSVGVEILASSENHADAWFGPYDFGSQDELEPLLLELVAHGILDGRVTYLGEPQSEFDLVHWTNHAFDATWQGFEDREEGRFVLDGLTPGPLQLYAVSGTATQSATHRLEVRPGERLSIELELTTPLPGRGRVVDLATRSALPDATVQPYTCDVTQPVTPWGEPVPVDADGSFHLEAFPPGSTVLAVEAPGYGMKTFRGTPDSRGVVDFGVLGLRAGSSMVVRLDGAMGSPEEYQLEVAGRRYFDWRAFGADGSLHFEDCIAGRYDFAVSGPGGRMWYIARHMPGAGPWDVALPLVPAGLVRLRVSTTPAGGADPRFVTVCQRLASGETVMVEATLDGSGAAEVAELAPGDAVAIAFDESWVELGSASFQVLDLPDQEVAVDIDAEAVAIRFVDRDANPVAGATVTVRCDGNRAGWLWMDETDAEGRIELPSPPQCGPLVACVRWGGGSSFPVDLPAEPSRGGVHEIVLEADHAVRVRLLERSDPFSGVEVGLHHAGLDQTFELGWPKGDGTIEWAALSEGRYEVRVLDENVWPIQQGVDATRGGSPTEIQVRTLGELEIRMGSDEEEPLGGRPVALVYEEWGASVEDWLGSERVRSSTGGLFADASGSLLVRGLPNGSYSWSVERGDLPALSGEVVVPPLARKICEISLP